MLTNFSKNKQTRESLESDFLENTFQKTNITLKIITMREKNSENSSLSKLIKDTCLYDLKTKILILVIYKSSLSIKCLLIMMNIYS